MPQLTVRPSIKGVIVWYVLSTLLLIAIVAFLYTRGFAPPELWALTAIPLGIDIWASMKHVKLNTKRLTLDNGVLRFEDGLLAKKQRSIMLDKIRDVRTEQTLGQRIVGIGDLSVDAQGETGAISLQNVDRPREAAEQILDAVRAARGTGR
ncbi:MAG: PH domain-containing protein [Acidobacteria bacterium]|nr:PH domain-containing protein [Acidobacteriota bacterium]